MYQLTIKNSDKVVKKGDYLSFTIAGFPPNTKVDFYISEHEKWTVVGEGEITSDSNGGGNFLTLCENSSVKYRLSVRNYAYGAAYDDFTVLEQTIASSAKTTTTTPSINTSVPTTTTVASTATETNIKQQDKVVEKGKVETEP